MDRNKLIVIGIHISLILAIFASIYEQSWMNLFVSALTLILTFIPNIVQKRYRITLPTFLQIFIIIFIYSGIFLGEVRSYYKRFWWWDSILHLTSGIALGFIGFLILYILYKSNKFKANPLIITMFAFSFALALGTIWEIYEFGMDQFFNLDMQKARRLSTQMFCDTRLGVIDTMFDLIIDSIGAIIASFAGYLFLKEKKVFFFGNIVDDFEKQNKSLFKRKRNSKNESNKNK